MSSVTTSTASSMSRSSSADPSGCELPSEPVTFSFATTDDARRIHRIVEAAYRAIGEDAGWTTESHLLAGQRTDLAEITELINSPAGGLLTARQGGQIVGSCELQRHEDHAYFGMFAVDPRVQATGLGNLLLARAEQVARQEWGLTEMRLTVIACRSELIAWYRRRGFRPTGATSQFPYDNPRFGLPRVEGLYFREFSKAL